MTKEQYKQRAITARLKGKSWKRLQAELTWVDKIEDINSWTDEDLIYLIEHDDFNPEAMTAGEVK